MSVEGSIDVSISVVLYRDYETPLSMVRSLAAHFPPEASVRLYAVDNSALAESDSSWSEREHFRRELESFGFAEYVDAGGNLGFGRANNLALAKADSRYHAFVNPDILFTEDAVSALLDFMDASRTVGMCVPRLTDSDGALQKVYWRQPSVLDAFNRTFLKNRLRKRDRYYTLSDADYSRPFRVPFAQGSFLFGRTSLLKELGGFDESFFMYLEDADLCRRVNERSELVYCPYASVVHLWERGSHKDMRLLKWHFQSYMRYFQKWGLRLV